MIDKYYEDELRYLYDSGREFAKAHPDRARFLNIDAVGDRDPYVERLFEGFAFLAARIREKIDDAFPELTGGILDLLWPHLLQEVPSLSIVEFRPRKGFLQETRTIARGAEILTGAVGSESAVCRFTTTSNVQVHPIALTAVEKTLDSKARATLHYKFRIDPGIKWGALRLSPLRVHLHAEKPTALTLYQLLTGHVVEARLTAEESGRTVVLDSATAVTPGGLTPDESLLPGDPRGFWGYSLLREYFVFPEKFLCVDLNGFDRLGDMDPGPEHLTYSVTFDRDIPPERPLRTENFRLFCTPVANIFKRDVEPVANTGRQVEYPVVADASYPESVRTHSVVSAIGIDRATGERRPYDVLHAFRNLGRKDLRTYATRYRIAPDGKRKCYITFGGNQLVAGELREENISLEAWCTNAALPREEVREGGISKPGPGFPDYVMVTNLTRPTLPSEPPKDEEFPWMFLSHASANLSSLGSTDTLKALLRLYDWSGEEGNARRVEAISQVSLRPVEAAVNGSVLRGVEFSVHLQETEFKEPGEMCLLGAVLTEFLTHYMSINSFVQLAMVLQPSGLSRRWSSLRGKKWPV